MARYHLAATPVGVAHVDCECDSCLEIALAQAALRPSQQGLAKVAEYLAEEGAAKARKTLPYVRASTPPGVTAVGKKPGT